MATNKRKIEVSPMALLCSLLALAALGIVNASYVSLDIRNFMPNPIGLHCWSGDDDKGGQVLAPNAVYGFGITLNFQATTLYSCNFLSTATHQKSGFQAWGKEVPCYKCLWSVRPDGFYVEEKNFGPPAVLTHPWVPV